jgi:hypothetical protein
LEESNAAAWPKTQTVRKTLTAASAKTAETAE